MNIIQELEWRGLLKQATNEDKINQAQQNGAGVYCGFDPTADSLHVGHLIPIILLSRFQKMGFKPIALIGGGTGMIGDPSFKSQERVLQTNEQVLVNVQGIQKQLKQMLHDVTFVNNYDWLNKLSLLDFLRDVGKDFTLSYLLAKESIASRISTGLSITEFSYTMLQAYDFYQLYTTKNCKVQIGGSDQWGNITSGIDYIGSQIGRDKSEAAGITIQLLAKKDGQKFGKTESGAVWLDPNKTSEYSFYQFWFNQNDDDCEMFLKFVTFLDQQAIQDLMAQHQKNPAQRIMQKVLAEEVTKFVHGAEGLKKALLLTEAFFNGTVQDLDANLITIAIASLQAPEIDSHETVIDAIVQSGAASSRREAREFINNKAISFNEIILEQEDQLLKDFPKLINNQFILIKRGKKKYFALKLKTSQN
ncbi:tyrosine--tRNA ligase [Williamsoniiplasma lucivorax]|uniref:Tyrosine--tRNA ligase n=1 Tax=Williamsoniiplasma lucivorax TaxID=209274 RepID=A0A2S5RG79_9MOLU|nr:tyrosine--tRNA ligase [Williamsoniiplasma lucivorax]PPE06135.1 tyrosyl-tRNA synthetase [Williamsoniiplasma lucivorax]